MSELSKLPNIGTTLVKQLLEVGIDTPEKLIEIGSKQAWLNIRSIDPSGDREKFCVKVNKGTSFQTRLRVKRKV